MSKTLQLSNTPTGEYDARKPLPYPYHVGDDGSILRQDFWRGEPKRLVGFQNVGVQEVVVLAEEWLKDDVDVVGMQPVFMDADGGFWNHAFAVSTS